ncbi:MAG: hypothetical protein QXU18_12025 [Thermoplasmatales archaeon]
MGGIKRFNPLSYTLRGFIDSIRDLNRPSLRTKKNRVSEIAILLIFVLPLLFTLLLLYYRVFMSFPLADSLLYVLSIFVALLLNLLLLIYEMSRKQPVEISAGKNNTMGIEEKKKNDRILLIRDISADVSFSIIVSIIAIMLLLASQIGAQVSFYLEYLGFAVYYFTFMFVALIFLDLTKITALFSNEFREPQK